MIFGPCNKGHYVHTLRLWHGQGQTLIYGITSIIVSIIHSRDMFIHYVSAYIDVAITLLHWKIGKYNIIIAQENYYIVKNSLGIIHFGIYSGIGEDWLEMPR